MGPDRVERPCINERVNKYSLESKTAIMQYCYEVAGSFVDFMINSIKDLSPPIIMIFPLILY